MEEFAQEFVTSFEICFDLLGRSHIYVLKKNLSAIVIFRSLFLKICTGLYYVGLIAYIGKAFSGEIDFFNLAVIVPVVAVASQGILKAGFILQSRSRIRNIIWQLGSTQRTSNLTDKQFERKYSMLNQLNNFHSGKGVRQTIVFYWMNILGSWQYILVPLFETLVRRFIFQQESELLLPFFCSFPFDQTKTWARYIAVYIFTSYSMMHLIYIYLGAEFLMITLCAHLSIEFCVLQEDLRHVTPSSLRNGLCDVSMTTNNNDLTGYDDKEAKDIIQKHQRLTDELNDIFNKMIFFNLLFATITICFFGFVATKARGPGDMVNNFVGVIASILPIFNLCYYGELLTGASAGIADAAYENLWYEFDDNYQKMLIFIIRRSQRPCCLTSLNYVPVSLNTFTTVMSTTWSYFSLATSVYEENN